MAIPTVYNVGTQGQTNNAGGGTATPGLPAGTTTGDLLLLFMETANQPVAALTGWSNVGAGIVQQASGVVTALTVRWKIAGGGETAPAITAGTVDHIVARIVGVRGHNPTTPINITATSVDNTASTSTSIPGATTTAPDCLVFAAFSTGTDVTSTAQASAWANASLTSVTERCDNWHVTGNGGGFGVATGGKATQGAYSATTVTIATANTKARMSFAVAAPVAATSANADVAAATGTALDATVSTTTSDTQAAADVAVSSGAALDASASVAVTADVATGVGSSLDVAAAASVTAGPAAAAGASLDAAAGAGVSAGVSTAAGSAWDATAALSVGSEVAAGVGSALDASAAVSGSTTATAGPATGTGVAFDATTLAAVTAAADIANGTAAAFPAAVAAVAAAEVAAGIGAAWDAVGSVPVLVGYTRRGSEAAPTVRGQLISV